MRYPILLTVALTVVLSPLGIAARTSSLKPDRSIIYKEPGGQTLSVHLFLPKDWKDSDQRPAAVFFFGGGWAVGHPSQFFPQAQALAKHGMVGISADYRTMSSHKTDPKACVEDGVSAVRWIRAHAKELGVDPNKLAAGGGSAGGHVAAASTFCKGFDAKGEDLSISTRANALILFNPVLDNGPDGGWGHSKVKDYWQSISPAHNISKPVPPTLFMLGTKDNLIPVSTATRFRDKVQAAGGRCDLMLHEDGKHGFFNDPPHLENTMREMITFLKSLGWIAEGAEATP